MAMVDEEVECDFVAIKIPISLNRASKKDSKDGCNSRGDKSWKGWLHFSHPLATLIPFPPDYDEVGQITSAFSSKNRLGEHGAKDQISCQEHSSWQSITRFLADKHI